MKRPVRLNRDSLRKAWPGLRRGCPDPRGLLNADIGAREATEIIAKIKIGGVFKTTRSNRFPQTTRLLADSQFSTPPVILDVGASDGSTSLGLIEAMNFSRYYVTDRHIDAYACPTSRGAFICDAEYNPFMYVNNLFVVYNDTNGSVWPLSSIVRRLFSDFDKAKFREMRRINLMNPVLLSRIGDGVHLQRYDIFEPWRFEKVDLVIAANILNRSYFSDARLIAALQNLRGAMKDSGRLALIENRSAEQSNIFRLHNGRFIVENEVGRGSDIKSLVTSLSDGCVADGHASRQGRLDDCTASQ